MILYIVRAVFLLVVLSLVVTIAFTAAERADEATGMSNATRVTLLMVIPVALAVLVMLVDVFWRRKNLQVLSGLFFGMLAGLAIAYVLGLVVELVAGVFIENPEAVSAVQLIKVLVGATVVFLCVSFVMQTKNDFRFIIPYVEFAKETKGTRPMLLDTSVIIDGRIADIAETGIIENELVVPRFILAELQAIADSADKLKRNRGRRGLDMLNRLQSSEKTDIRILDARASEVEEGLDVDAKLVALAKNLNGRVVTNDYNLNKISQLRGVGVININDLANALKPVVLPGEAMTVKMIKAGEEVGQGIGYLEDGTMVVAEQGRDHIGEDITITITSVLQTSAGRMIFGRMEGAAAQRPRNRR